MLCIHGHVSYPHDTICEPLAQTSAVILLATTSAGQIAICREKDSTRELCITLSSDLPTWSIGNMFAYLIYFTISSPTFLSWIN